MIYTGIAAVQMLCQEEGAHGWALSLWDLLYESALSIVARAGSASAIWLDLERWRAATIMLISILPPALRDLNEDGQVAIVSYALAGLGGEDALVAEAVRALRDGQVAGPLVKRALAEARVDLNSLIANCDHYWPHLDVPHSHSLAAALGVCRALLREP